MDMPVIVGDILACDGNADTNRLDRRCRNRKYAFEALNAERDWYARNPQYQFLVDVW